MARVFALDVGERDPSESRGERRRQQAALFAGGRDAVLEHALPAAESVGQLVQVLGIERAQHHAVLELPDLPAQPVAEIVQVEIVLGDQLAQLAFSAITASRAKRTMKRA